MMDVLASLPGSWTRSQESSLRRPMAVAVSFAASLPTTEPFTGLVRTVVAFAMLTGKGVVGCVAAFLIFTSPNKSIVTNCPAVVFRRLAFQRILTPPHALLS